MGFMLTRRLVFDQPSTYKNRIEVTQIFRRRIAGSSPDYRDVIVTRDWYDSLISGWLYHKGGRECETDAYGKSSDILASRTFNNNWETLMTTIRPDPPRRNRSLCAYLQEESVRDGMRVYIDVAFGRWYQGLVDNWEIAQTLQDKNRTLFVCYEKLTDRETYVKTASQILDWLFPSYATNGASDWDIDEPEEEEYRGKHSTSHDVIRRKKLKSVVELVDRSDFGGRIANLNKLFGCGDGERQKQQLEQLALSY